MKTPAALDVFRSPIVRREALTRARSWTTPVSIMLYLCMLGGFALAMFSIAVSRAPAHRPDAGDMANAAYLTMAFQLALVLLFTPAVAAGAISSERERGTLDVLLLGRLRAGDLAAAKLIASVAHLLLLIVAALPIVVAVFLHAGLELRQLLMVELVTVVTTLTLAALAVFLSSVARRTGVATATAYGVTILLYIGSALVEVIPALDKAEVKDVVSVHPFIFANPFYAVDAIVNNIGSSSGAHIGRLLQLFFFQGGKPSTWGWVVQPWHLSLLAQLALFAACLAMTARAVAGRRVLPFEITLRKERPAKAQKPKRQKAAPADDDEEALATAAAPASAAPSLISKDKDPNE